METMIRSEKWKLVYFLKETVGQLFDLEKDPEERNNLWDSIEHIDKREVPITICDNGFQVRAVDQNDGW